MALYSFICFLLAIVQVPLMLNPNNRAWLLNVIVCVMLVAMGITQ